MPLRSAYIEYFHPLKFPERSSVVKLVKEQKRPTSQGFGCSGCEPGCRLAFARVRGRRRRERVERDTSFNLVIRSKLFTDDAIMRFDSGAVISVVVRNKTFRDATKVSSATPRRAHGRAST